MKKSMLLFVSISSLCAALAVPFVAAAQEEKNEHHHYKLIDMGTFGGPAACLATPIPGS
jgi:hypothetical protein